MLNHKNIFSMKNVQKPVHFSYNSFPIISSRNFLKLSRLHPVQMVCVSKLSVYLDIYRW